MLSCNIGNYLINHQSEMYMIFVDMLSNKNLQPRKKNYLSEAGKWKFLLFLSLNLAAPKNTRLNSTHYSAFPNKRQLQKILIKPLSYIKYLLKSLSQSQVNIETVREDDIAKSSNYKGQFEIEEDSNPVAQF